MQRDEFSEKLVVTLYSVLKEHPRMLVRVLKSLGLSESYMRSVKRPQHQHGMKVGTVGAALEVAGIEPAVFWMRAFPENTDALTRFASEARVLADSFVQPKTLVSIKERVAASELVHGDERSHHEEIRTLNRERFTNLKRTAQRAASLARQRLEYPVVARALGVWATTLRMQDKHTTAAMVLGFAIECADEYTTIKAELAPILFT